MTAIELLIVVAAIGLLVLISVPGTSMLIERYRLHAASNDLAAGLSLARSEAITRGSTVRMCPSADGSSCMNGGDWSHGWLVYTDGNADGVVQDIELIEAFEGPAEDIRIFGSAAVEESASFNVSGLIGGYEASRPSRGGEFLVCYLGSKVTAKAVVIDAEGWVNIVPTGSGDCAAPAG